MTILRNARSDVRVDFIYFFSNISFNYETSIASAGWVILIVQNLQLMIIYIAFYYY